MDADLWQERHHLGVDDKDETFSTLHHLIQSTDISRQVVVDIDLVHRARGWVSHVAKDGEDNTRAEDATVSNYSQICFALNVACSVYSVQDATIARYS